MIIVSEERQDVYLRAYRLWGRRNREDKLIEEGGELFQAIMKGRYNPNPSTTEHMIEGLVDLSILVEQMFFIMDQQGWRAEIQRLNQAKFEKLKRKLERGEV